MPRFPDFNMDFSNIDVSIDPEIPDYNITFQPLALPDAPRLPPPGLSAEDMPLIPKVPDLSFDIPLPSVEIPKLPNLPPAPQMPSLSPAIEAVLEIFHIVTEIQCLYRKVPIAPEWV